MKVTKRTLANCFMTTGATKKSLHTQYHFVPSSPRVILNRPIRVLKETLINQLSSYKLAIINYNLQVKNTRLYEGGCTPPVKVAMVIYHTEGLKGTMYIALV